MNTPPADRAPHAGWYRIRIQGHLAPRWAHPFRGDDPDPEDDGTTLIQGPVVDQAALHGLLQQVRDTGLPLISVTQAGPTSPPPHPPHPASPHHAPPTKETVMTTTTRTPAQGLPARTDGLRRRTALRGRRPVRDHLHHVHHRQVRVLPTAARQRRLHRRRRAGHPRAVGRVLRDDPDHREHRHRRRPVPRPQAAVPGTVPRLRHRTGHGVRLHRASASSASSPS